MYINGYSNTVFLGTPSVEYSVGVGSPIRTSGSVITFTTGGTYAITYVPQSASPGHVLNAVFLSSAQTLSNVTISSEMENAGSLGGGSYDMWGQVVVASNSGTITFTSGSGLPAAFGTNWTTGQWYCQLISFIQIT